jgi:hypothetical protein
MPGGPGARLEPGRPERSLRATCAELDVPCLLLGGERGRGDFKPHDDHGTERGHRRVADALSRFLAAS